MKCPQCVKEGLRSIVRSHGGTVTCMGWSPYYDEDGTFHSHDPNRHANAFSCGNGHQFTQTSYLHCPACDYGKDSEEITLREPMKDRSFDSPTTTGGISSSEAPRTP